MTARTVAILSPGDMGSGLGRLLRKNSFRVVTNLEGRSARSKELAQGAGFEDLGSDYALLTTADILISVLVPSSSTATAQTIAACSKEVQSGRLRTKFYIDANAVSPGTVKKMSALFADSGITFIDGSIIGGPPHLRPDGTWYRPTFALSGPGTRDINLDDVFDVSHVGPQIGQASALKMSFASLTKVDINVCLYVPNLNRDLLPLQFNPSERRMQMDCYSH
jgi:3-hydroxyisobutyrate dehydrogenase-like beta-hydroxyacid dehydrogenase